MIQYRNWRSQIRSNTWINVCMCLHLCMHVYVCVHIATFNLFSKDFWKYLPLYLETSAATTKSPLSMWNVCSRYVPVCEYDWKCLQNILKRKRGRIDIILIQCCIPNKLIMWKIFLKLKKWNIITLGQVTFSSFFLAISFSFSPSDFHWLIFFFLSSSSPSFLLPFPSLSFSLSLSLARSLAHPFYSLASFPSLWHFFAIVF